MKRYSVTITRSERDGRVARGDYTIDFDEQRTVVDLLGAIEHEHDSDLVYRHSCHHGSCGTCTVRVNGAEVLACTTTLESLGSTELRIEPLSGFPIAADLAVDASRLFSTIPAGISHLRPVEPEPAGTPPEEIDRYVRFENCIECGACLSACPVSATFLGPAALAALAVGIEHEPARREVLLDIAAGPLGVGGCVRSFDCSRVCPTGVYPSRKIIDLATLISRP
jgi:succinate dehydrogenase/fumarate reductase iron-sulfur protein